MRFKIGDKIRVVKTNPVCPQFLGKIGTVSNVTDWGLVEFNIEQPSVFTRCCAPEEYLELFKSKPTCKSDKNEWAEIWEKSST